METETEISINSLMKTGHYALQYNNTTDFRSQIVIYAGPPLVKGSNSYNIRQIFAELRARARVKVVATRSVARIYAYTFTLHLSHLFFLLRRAFHLICEVLLGKRGKRVSKATATARRAKNVTAFAAI